MEPFYKQYFQNLVAVSLWLKSFVYINDKYNLEGFENAVKSLAASPNLTPALLLDQYSYDVADTGTRNYFRGIMGQFTILLKTTKGNQGTIETARVQSEMITDLIIARMRYDLGEGGTVIMPGTDISSNRIFYKVKAKVQPVGPINADYYGTTCVFEWKTSFTTPVSSTDWTDIT